MLTPNLTLTLVMIIWAALAIAFTARPRWGLAALVGSLPFEYIGTLALNSQTGHPLIRPAQLVGAALITAWGLCWIKGQSKLRPIAGWRWLLLFTISAGVSAATVNHAVVWTSWVVLVFNILLVFVVAQLCDEDALPLLYRSLFASAVAVSLFGIYQYLGDVAGLSPALTGLRPAYTTIVFGFPRVQSTALEPLYFANYLLLPLFAGLALLVRRQSPKQLWHYLGLSTIALAFLLTTSRGAFLAAAAGLVVLILTQLRKITTGIALRALAALVLLGAVGGGLIGLSSLRNQGSFWLGIESLTHFVSDITQSASFAERSQTIQIGQNLAAQNQLFGIGLGGIGPKLGSHPTASDTGFVALNSEGLELVIQVGYVGLLLLAAFYLRLLTAGWRESRDDGPKAAWAGGLAVAIVATLVQAQTFSGFFLTYRWVTLGVLAGLVSGAPAHSFSIKNLKKLV